MQYTEVGTGAGAMPASQSRLRPLAAGALLCAGHVILWGLAFTATFRAANLDSAEQLVWGYALEGGYWKHPPLPSWIMHVLMGVFSPSVALPFFAGQACIVAALALIAVLASRFMSHPRVLLGLAFTSLVIYYNVGGDAFNHSVAMLPFVAAACLAFHRALRGGHWGWWCAAGVLTGASILVKYLALLPLAGVFLYVVLDRRTHTRRALAGLALAGACCAVVISPHLLWLVQSDFLPLRYAQSVAYPAQGGPSVLSTNVEFAIAVLARSLPMLLVAWWVLRRRDEATSAAVTPQPDRLFLWCVGLTPLVLTFAWSIATGAALQARWGTSSLLFSGWLLVDAWGREPGAERVRSALRWTAGVQLALCLLGTVLAAQVASSMRWPGRSNFPAHDLSMAAQQTWARYTDAPLRLVVSDAWLGGNMAAQMHTPLAVLIDGDAYKSPWIDADAVRRCGALILINRRPRKSGPDPTPSLELHWKAATYRGEWSLAWPGSAREMHEARAHVAWGVVAPEPGARCGL